MRYFPAAFETLTEQFARLPGIGAKTAQRLAYHIVSLPEDQVHELASAIWQGRKAVKYCSICGNYTAEFASAILQAKKTIHTCPVCQNLTDEPVCSICSDPQRDHGQICVVAEPKDVIAMERTREYHGLYHVLHGVISPLNHIGPDDIRIRELLDRVGKEEVREVIMATNPDTEGEATAMYLSRLLRPLEIKVTRLAYGIPVGSQLEYADEITLLRALEGRCEI